MTQCDVQKWCRLTTICSQFKVVHGTIELANNLNEFGPKLYG